MVKPSDGDIEIFGKNIENNFRFARSQVGIAHQEVSTDWFFPLEQLLYFQAGFYGVSRSNAKERIEYLLEKLGLSKHRTKKMRELSGGMKRRLQIAKALVHDPEIIILDEPTAGVDVELRHDLWLYLQELHKDGKTILLTTHYIDEAELLCERVGIIDKGKLIVEDTPVVPPVPVNEDPNVVRSEIDDIRKSVVSMSVGQPDRTTTIVKEWLEQPAPAPPEPAGACLLYTSPSLRDATLSRMPSSA